MAPLLHLWFWEVRRLSRLLLFLRLWKFRRLSWLFLWHWEVRRLSWPFLWRWDVRRLSRLFLWLCQRPWRRGGAHARSRRTSGQRDTWWQPGLSLRQRVPYPFSEVFRAPPRSPPRAMLLGSAKKAQPTP